MWYGRAHVLSMLGIGVGERMVWDGLVWYIDARSCQSGTSLAVDDRISLRLREFSGWNGHGPRETERSYQYRARSQTTGSRAKRRYGGGICRITFTQGASLLLRVSSHIPAIEEVAMDPYSKLSPRSLPRSNCPS